MKLINLRDAIAAIQRSGQLDINLKLEHGPDATISKTGAIAYLAIALSRGHGATISGIPDRICIGQSPDTDGVFFMSRGHVATISGIPDRICIGQSPDTDGVWLLTPEQEKTAPIL